MINEIFNRILPGNTEKEKLEILEKACRLEIFEVGLPEGCTYDPDTGVLSIEGVNGKQVLVYSSFLRIFLANKKASSPPRSEKTRLTDIIRKDKRHLRYVDWYKRITCYTIKEDAIEFIKKEVPVKSYKDFESRDEWIFYKNVMKGKMREVGLHFLEISELEAFKRFYNEQYKDFLRSGNYRAKL
jgi:hypothetical protein